MDNSQAIPIVGPIPAAVDLRSTERDREPVPTPSGRTGASAFGRFLRHALTPTLLGVVGLGLVSTVLDVGAWATNADLQRLGSILATGVVSMALLSTWLAFVRRREDHDVLSGRLALAVPCLFWASQSISSPLLLTEPAARQVPAALRVGAGLVGAWLIACDLVRRDRAISRSFAAGLILSILSASSIALIIRWGLAGRPNVQSQVRLLAATVAFPALWGTLGLLTLGRASSSRAVVRRCVGTALLLLAAAQVVAPPSLGVADTKRAVVAGCAGLIGVGVLLGGLCHDLRIASDAKHSRLVAAEFDAAEGVDLLNSERLLHSRTLHDQKAALLSIEAVIQLLVSSEAIDPAARRRLCDAATDELRRLRGTTLDSTESDLRELVSPVVALASAAGAKVTMRIRPGLEVYAGPALVDIVRNLISNAVRHGGNTDVTIEARRRDYEFVELTVSDKGPGIASARRFDLFEPGSSSGGVESSGLGLHSARTLLREMGGDLQLDRSYVGGARFAALIPASGTVRSSKHA